MVIRRYPKSENRSLRPFSAADELILEHVKNENINLNSCLILNDRFGYLACSFHSYRPVNIINYKSQEKSIRLNMIDNDLPLIDQKIITPFESFEGQIETVLMKVPKSNDLFEFQLANISEKITDNCVIICGFMTRHFSRRILEIANEYFEVVEQTQAKKKARLLILKKKKSIKDKILINEVKLNEKTLLKQYYGVFSANQIDFATQFFLEHLSIDKSSETILDLAAGNGVIAHQIRQKNKTAELHLVDDNFLAVESGKLNLSTENTYHHFSDGLENFLPKFFDLIVCNPPFHFEHETNIEVSLQLFKEVKKALKPNGSFKLVANQHLNYKTHLTKIFSKVSILAENEKFIIYDCLK